MNNDFLSGIENRGHSSARSVLNIQYPLRSNFSLHEFRCATYTLSSVLITLAMSRTTDMTTPKSYND